MEGFDRGLGSVVLKEEIFFNPLPATASVQVDESVMHGGGIGMKLGALNPELTHLAHGTLRAILFDSKFKLPVEKLRLLAQCWRRGLGLATPEGHTVAKHPRIFDRAARDAAVATGMADGVATSYDRLETIWAELMPPAAG